MKKTIEIAEGVFFFFKIFILLYCFWAFVSYWARKIQIIIEYKIMGIKK